MRTSLRAVSSKVALSFRSLAAGAHQVAIAIDVVDASDRRPIFVRSGCFSREATLRARIRSRPIVVRKVLGRVRRQPKCRSRDRDFARLDLGDLLADRDHGIAEPVELLLRFGFCRLDRQGARDWKAHRRSMEAVVDEAFGNIIDGYTASFL